MDDNSRYNLQRSEVFFLGANYQKRQRFSIFQQRSVFPPRHFREISSSLGGVAERCSRRRKKGQRPWRRKEMTRISLPLCTRENGISRWPIIFRKGRFWHRGCHSPLPSIPNDRSISQKFYPFIRTREAMLFLCTRYFLIRIAFCRPTWSATLHAIWKKRLSIQLNWIHAPRV